MYVDNVFLKFQGFHPSDFTKNQFAAIAQELQYESPIGSIVRASIVKNAKQFQGMVRITSAGGTFFAKATGRRISEVNHRLMNQIRRQLSKWKTLRFRRGGLRDLRTEPSTQSDAQEMYE